VVSKQSSEITNLARVFGRVFRAENLGMGSP
jgi:hypothetical protein